MKHLILTICLMLVVSVVQAQEESKVLPTHYVTFGYYAANSNWWCGLAIYNNSSLTRNYMLTIHSDAGGGSVGSAIFTMEGNTIKVGLLSDLITSGYVPARGSIHISADGRFTAEKFMGNAQGGFGEVEKEAQMY